MRKSFNGLSGLVRDELGRNPAGGEVFIFLNRRRTLLKLLHWESGGFVLYYKRLEEGTFAPPTIAGDQTVVRWPVKGHEYSPPRVNSIPHLLSELSGIHPTNYMLALKF